MVALEDLVSTFVELDDLYSFLAQRQPVAAARQRVRAIYEKVHSWGDGNALRLSGGRYKKLQDEVRPALIFAAKELPPRAQIQFHLGDRGHDATAWPDANSSPIQIEVTVAGGKVRYRQMKVLNESGVAHGFTFATDRDTQQQIEAQYENYRGYTLEEAFKNVGANVCLCVGRKAEDRHRGLTLLVFAPGLQELCSRHKWNRYVSELARDLPSSPCESIYLVGGSLDDDVSFRLK